MPTEDPSGSGAPAMIPATAVPCQSTSSSRPVTFRPATTSIPPPRPTPESRTATDTPAPGSRAPSNTFWAFSIPRSRSGALEPAYGSPAG